MGKIIEEVIQQMWEKANYNKRIELLSKATKNNYTVKMIYYQTVPSEVRDYLIKNPGEIE